MESTCPYLQAVGKSTELPGSWPSHRTRPSWGWVSDSLRKARLMMMMVSYALSTPATYLSLVLRIFVYTVASIFETMFIA